MVRRTFAGAALVAAVAVAAACVDDVSVDASRPPTSSMEAGTDGAAGRLDGSPSSSSSSSGPGSGSSSSGDDPKQSNGGENLCGQITQNSSPTCPHGGGSPDPSCKGETPICCVGGSCAANASFCSTPAYQCFSGGHCKGAVCCAKGDIVNDVPPNCDYSSGAQLGGSSCESACGAGKVQLCIVTEGGPSDCKVVDGVQFNCVDRLLVIPNPSNPSVPFLRRGGVCTRPD